jgi:hypothetical protein
MKCNEFREKVADLFDKTIDMQTQAELDKHMRSCPECKAYYDELRETFDMLQPRDEVKSEETKAKNNSDFIAPRSSLWKTAAIFIAAAFLCGLAYAAYHAISVKQESERCTNEKMLALTENGEKVVVTWLKGTWVEKDNGSYIEDYPIVHSPALPLCGEYRATVKVDGKDIDAGNLPDLPASSVKKVEIHFCEGKTVNLITTPVQIPADVKGNINPDLTILLTGTVPKGAYQPVTIWKSKGIKESYDWHDYIYTSWTGQWENIQRHLNEVVNRKDHHVRINVCKGTPQKHIDRIKSIMQECGVTNYEIVKQ